MEQSENQKLKQFRKQLDISQDEFSNALGIKQGSYSDIERGKVAISSTIMQKLVNLFGFNPAWYYTGEGEMMNQPSGTINYDWTKRNRWGVTLDNPEVRPLSDSERFQSIPLVQPVAYAGFVEGFSDTEYLSQQPVVYIPDLPKGQWVAFQIQGNSMEPTLQTNDVLITKRIERYLDIVPQKIYVVVTQNGIFVKRISMSANTNKTNPLIDFISDNPAHEAFQVPSSEIRHIWQAHQRITTL